MDNDEKEIKTTNRYIIATFVINGITFILWGIYIYLEIFY